MEVAFRRLEDLRLTGLAFNELRLRRSGLNELRNELSIGQVGVADFLAALRTEQRALAERHPTVGTAAGDFWLRHRWLARFLHSMHRVEKVFALSVDTHAQMFSFASQPILQLRGAFTRARGVGNYHHGKLSLHHRLVDVDNTAMPNTEMIILAEEPVWSAALA